MADLRKTYEWKIENLYNTGAYGARNLKGQELEKELENLKKLGYNCEFDGKNIIWSDIEKFENLEDYEELEAVDFEKKYLLKEEVQNKLFKED